MHPEFQLREEHFVVIELETFSIKLGPADPMLTPAITIPNAVYISHDGEEGRPLIGSALQNALDEGRIDRTQLTFPIKDGHIEDWALVETILNHVITGELKVKKSRNHSPILLSIPAHWSRNDREILVQMLFEKFNVPGLYIAERPLMALYGYGQHLTGLVLEFAHDRIEVVPIVDAAVQQNALGSSAMGHAVLLDYLARLIEKDTQFKREYPHAIDTGLLEYLLTEICEVSPGPLESDKSRKDKEIPRANCIYQNRHFTIGDARYKVYESLFVPRMLDLPPFTRSITESIVHSTWSIDADRRIHVLDNIVLAGNYCKIKGFKARLEKDIKRFLCQTDFANEIQPKDIKFGRMPEFIEALKGRTQDASWLGAAIVAKLIFPDMKNYITKLDYNDCGPSILHSKGY